MNISILSIFTFKLQFPPSSGLLFSAFWVRLLMHMLRIGIDLIYWKSLQCFYSLCFILWPIKKQNYAESYHAGGMYSANSFIFSFSVQILPRSTLTFILSGPIKEVLFAYWEVYLIDRLSPTCMSFVVPSMFISQKAIKKCKNKSMWTEFLSQNIYIDISLLGLSALLASTV